VLPLVSVDVGGADGYSGRSRICQVFSRRFENSDCLEGWEQNWALLRGDSIWFGRSERFHYHP
jgi:hypothetical protein